MVKQWLKSLAFSGPSRESDKNEKKKKKTRKANAKLFALNANAKNMILNHVKIYSETEVQVCIYMTQLSVLFHKNFFRIKQMFFVNHGVCVILYIFSVMLSNLR